MNSGFDCVNDILDIDAMNCLDIIRQGRKRKTFKARSDPFLLNEDDFKLKYRFSKDYVRRITDVREDILRDPRGGSISYELQVLTALRTWARNEVQDDAGDIPGVSQQSITNICRRVAIALGRRSRHFIRMPSTNLEQEEVMAQFRQVVCDASLRIRDIVARWRGSTHYSRIFRENRIKRRLEAGEFKGRLLADYGYACTPYEFTPILNPSNAKEESYNRSHIRTRNVVERCFGVWKQRFRCLLKGFTNSLENTKIYIVALAVLHNIAIDMGEQNIGYVFPPEEGNATAVGMPPNNLQGQAARNAFINNYF